MNTDEIRTFLHSFLGGTSSTYAVIPCDYLSKLVISYYPLCLVVNTGRSNTRGDHWVSFFQENRKASLKFVDSYGIGISFYDEEFSNFIRRLNVPLVENNRCLQSLNSLVCGEYAIYFLYKLHSSCCLMSIYCNFTGNTKSNDRKVKAFVRKKLTKLRLQQKYSSSSVQCCTPFK